MHDQPAPSAAPAARPGGVPSADFNLRPPAEAAPAAPGTTLVQPAPGAQVGAQVGTPINAAALPGEAGLSGTDAVIGTAILLVLAVAIFFVRGAVRGHLIASRASPSAAGRAGWALFAFLLSLSVLIVFGLIGSLWSVLAFSAPLVVLMLVTLVLFALLYHAAARGRRPGRR